MSGSSSHFPNHVAIIMDGNARWAKQHHLPMAVGHQRGAEALRTLLQNIEQLGIHYLTVYAFSYENWNRSEDEINNLMQMLRYHLGKEADALHEQGVQIRFIGDHGLLDQDIFDRIREVEHMTKENSRAVFTMALSYGSRHEITGAIKKIAHEISAGKLDEDAIDETLISRLLDTKDLPDPDLLIRTGGDQRISNFLLWQSAYTELYFTDILWPDFTAEHMKEAMDAYSHRERRFGARRYYS